MSRVTPIPPPVKRSFQQFIRSISSSSKTGHPSALLDSRARINSYLPRAVKDLKAECSKRQLKISGTKAELVERLAAHDLVSAHAYHTVGASTTITRPVASTVSHRIVPLMQGFHTSSPKQAAHDNSTIDYAFLPSLTEQIEDLYAAIRVPILPDNDSVDRSVLSSHAEEHIDGAVAGADIIAANPDNVTASISEVVGNDGLDVDIGQLTSIFSSTQQKAEEEVGVFVELWRSMLEDIFGPNFARAN